MLKTYDAWKKIRLKHISKSIGQYGANLSTGNYLENGVRFLRTTDIQDNGELIESELGAYVDKSLVQDYLLKHGDILFSRSGTLGRSYLHTNKVTGDFAFAGYLVRFNINFCTHPKFIFYISKSSEFLAQIEADAIQTTISNFNGEKYGNIKISIPSLETQKVIAHFLDRKTAAIDTLIAKKQRLIQLLEEERTALINQAVTKGLSAITPMKDSGIPWIGEIPEHWEARRLKFVLDKIVDCKNRTPVYADDGDYAVVRTTNIRQGKFLFENLLKTDRANYEAWSQREVPQAGHIIFTREAPAGEACKVPESLKLCLGQRTMLFIPNEKLLNSDFLLLSIYGGAVDSFVKSVSSGSTVSHLRIEQVGDIPIFVPPLQEQEFICQEIHTQLAKQENLLKITQCSMEKLQEYRRSLITAAVTGKLDITQEKTP